PFLKPNEAPFLAVHLGPSSLSTTYGMRSFSSREAIDVNRSGGIQGRSRWQSAEMRLYCMRGSLIGRIVRACWPAGRGADFDSQREAAMSRMDGRVAVVTGASRGIGQAIAALLAQEGAKVVCVARTLKEGDHPLKGSLASTVGEITAAGGEATPIAADI